MAHHRLVEEDHAQRHAAHDVELALARGEGPAHGTHDHAQHLERKGQLKYRCLCLDKHEALSADETKCLMLPIGRSPVAGSFACWDDVSKLRDVIAGAYRLERAHLLTSITCRSCSLPGNL